MLQLHAHYLYFNKGLLLKYIKCNLFVQNNICWK